MNTYAVTYTYSVESAVQRDAVRPNHVEFLQALFDSGRLLVSGPLDAGTGALLVIQAPDEAEAAAVMDGDPFAQAGLITERTISQWNIFFGRDKLQVPAGAQG
ncbi:YciI family protein [Arthrobacter sp. zg-Y916]|uniref:YciI family protein n=1 Tax=Arthrobacter sp. zg-Y916 TaxID=2894190 RepID=UPI001E5430EC|nr:YciI family protein [Arthrobacter sp. zg-Y916]MCC9192345.1 YciI family protein [Arthrobacter sp. zg-Y916]